MEPEASSEKPSWQSLHCHLRDDLQKEVHLTRELLSNMHQEEVSLMLNDGGSLCQLQEQQHYLFERLSNVRQHRQEVTTEIEKMVPGGPKTPSIDQVLPPTEEISAEILSLSDQLVALTERMNRQHSQNQRLTSSGGRQARAHFFMHSEPRAKRKVSVATYHLKK